MPVLFFDSHGKPWETCPTHTPGAAAFGPNWAARRISDWPSTSFAVAQAAGEIQANPEGWDIWTPTDLRMVGADADALASSVRTDGPCPSLSLFDALACPGAIGAQFGVGLDGGWSPLFAPED
jgi:hypothetical protein